LSHISLFGYARLPVSLLMKQLLDRTVLLQPVLLDPGALVAAGGTPGRYRIYASPPEQPLPESLRAFGLQLRPQPLGLLLVSPTLLTHALQVVLQPVQLVL
jgi:hypothetical protein